MFLTKDNNVKWGKLAIAFIVTIALVLLGVFWYDKPLYLFMRNFNCGLWNIFDVVFDGELWVALIATCVLIFYVKKSIHEKPKFRNAKNKFSIWVFVKDAFNKIKTSNVFFVLCSLLVAGGLVKILKIFIGRARPIFFESLNMTGFFPPSTEWAFNSMPSGHAAEMFAMLVMVGLLVPKIKIYTWTLAIIIGASRVMYGAHWPTDVLLGAFIGMVVADLVKAFLVKKVIR